MSACLVHTDGGHGTRMLAEQVVRKQQVARPGAEDAPPSLDFLARGFIPVCRLDRGSGAKDNPLAVE